MSVNGLHLVDNEEYSEAGRAVYPDGLYKLLTSFHSRCTPRALPSPLPPHARHLDCSMQGRCRPLARCLGSTHRSGCVGVLLTAPWRAGRYRQRHPGLRYMVTENGIADADDHIRRLYMLEHLASLHAAMQQVRPSGAHDWSLHRTSQAGWGPQSPAPRLDGAPSPLLLAPHLGPVRLKQAGGGENVPGAGAACAAGGVARWLAQGVPVDAYIHWTISDNWEWSDGYCPKFGLVDVQREKNLTRVPRASYHLYKEVSATPAQNSSWRSQGLCCLGVRTASLLAARGAPFPGVLTGVPP